MTKAGTLVGHGRFFILIRCGVSYWDKLGYVVPQEGKPGFFLQKPALYYTKRGCRLGVRVVEATILDLVRLDDSHQFRGVKQLCPFSFPGGKSAVCRINESERS